MTTRPLPQPDQDSEAFWTGTKEGKLLIQHCDHCNRMQFFPRYFCTTCAGEVRWIETAGKGEVHTFSIVRQNHTPPFNELTPYVLAIIELEEGVRMMGNVIDVPIEDVEIGMPVEVRFVAETDDIVLPLWAPAGSSVS